MVYRVLIAAGGEVAIRIARTLIENGFTPLGVYTHTDRDSLHRKYVVEDFEIHSYEDVDEVIYAAQQLGADGVHPGYGVLLNESEYAEKIIRSDLVFIGPPQSMVSVARDKIALKTYAEKIGIPTLPWLVVEKPEDVIGFASEYGYPLILKPVAGKWGIGVRVVYSEGEVEDKYKYSKSIASKFFKDPRIYVEPFIISAKHVEVQVIGDREKVIHFYDRECLISPRFRRLFTEAPSPSLKSETRKIMLDYAVQLARSLRYENTGVVEFLYDPRADKVYFVELNPGLSPEHSASEVILKRDIVKKQLEIAFYKVTGLKQEEVSVDGCAIQSNIYAENPITGEKSNGRVEYYMEPGGPGVWVESELYEGLTSPPRELVAKIIAWSVDRKTCFARIKRALYEVVVGGLQTNIDYLRQLLNSSVFESGVYNFGEVEKVDRLIASRLSEVEDLHAVVLSSLLEFDDKGAKKYVRRSKALSSILRGEKVSSLKRSAWHYYIALKTTLERHYTQPKRREKRR